MDSMTDYENHLNTIRLISGFMKNPDTLAKNLANIGISNVQIICTTIYTKVSVEINNRRYQFIRHWNNDVIRYFEIVDRDNGNDGDYEDDEDEDEDDGGGGYASDDGEGEGEDSEGEDSNDYNNEEL
jgi:hypothetical protein